MAAGWRCSLLWEVAERSLAERVAGGDKVGDHRHTLPGCMEQDIRSLGTEEGVPVHKAVLDTVQGAWAGLGTQDEHRTQAELEHAGMLGWYTGVQGL